MKPPINLVEPLEDDLAPLLLDGLPFDPSVQFSSMGFLRKQKLRKTPLNRKAGRNSMKRDIAKER